MADRQRHLELCSAGTGSEETLRRIVRETHPKIKTISSSTTQVAYEASTGREHRAPKEEPHGLLCRQPEAKEGD